jgi:hypothetical protein
MRGIQATGHPKRKTEIEICDEEFGNCDEMHYARREGERVVRMHGHAAKKSAGDLR